MNTSLRRCHPRSRLPAGFIVALVASLAWLVVGCSTGTEKSPSSPDSELRFHWVVPSGFPGTVSLYRALDGQPTGETLAHSAGETPRLGSPLSDATLRGRLDEAQRIVLKVDNPGAEPLRFWVAPHLPQPHDGETALMTQCLCTGAIYEVPARGSWTRVLEFGIRRRGAVTPLSVTHVIVLGEPPR